MTTTMFRASAPQAETISRLGPLGELPGTWVGNGFNLISLPDKHDNKPFRLKLNATKETLSFRMIGAPIPNRGSVQDDIEFLGVHYFQQVSDAKTNVGLHLEPGLWLNTPITTNPPQPKAGVARLGTIPHGDSVSFSGIFWIETVQNPHNTQFLQLQYTQTVILDFIGIKWPHISVATLVKQ